MRNAYFKDKALPYILLLPQIAVTLIFFIWPTLSALSLSFKRGDAFGIHSHFVGLANFISLFSDPFYLHSFIISIVYAAIISIVVMSLGMLLALAVNRIHRGKAIYKTLLIWPYAVAPAVAGILWRLMFNPAIGNFAIALDKLGIQWNYHTHPGQAFALISIAAIWQQISYNFLFYLAAVAMIPKSLIEAAKIDGASGWQRLYSIIIPLLSPTTFFLIVMNVLYTLFDTFGIVHVVTQGGPAGATNILVHKVYQDGFVALDLGGSAAQSVILLLFVIMLTVVQFRFIEKKVHY